MWYFLTRYIIHSIKRYVTLWAKQLRVLLILNQINVFFCVWVSFLKTFSLKSILFIVLSLMVPCTQIISTARVFTTEITVFVTKNDVAGSRFACQHLQPRVCMQYLFCRQQQHLIVHVSDLSINRDASDFWPKLICTINLERFYRGSLIFHARSSRARVL